MPDSLRQLEVTNVKECKGARAREGYNAISDKSDMQAHVNLAGTLKLLVRPSHDLCDKFQAGLSASSDLQRASLT